MADAKALTRVLDELFWSLRREGLAISTAQAIDAARIAALVGLLDRERFRISLQAILVHSSDERKTFERAFSAFFGARSGKTGLKDRLLGRGLLEDEVAELWALLKAMGSNTADEMAPLGMLLERSADMDRLLSLVTGGLTSGPTARAQLGFTTHRVLHRMGMGEARKSLAALRTHLGDAFGSERADAILALLKAELDATESELRDSVRSKVVPAPAPAEGASGRQAATTPFASLDPEEVSAVRRAVARFAERLRGRARVRAHRAQRGRIDPHRTLRRAFATGGVPFKTLRKRPRRNKPALMLLCDVSDSVRATATFMLELVYAAQELWDGTRSFVFVSELGETTELFAREPIHQALASAYGGEVISVVDNSNYGRALRDFDERFLHEVNRHTTVVILGDGRTNYHDDAAEVLEAIRSRARALLWLCPEPKTEWGVGDSAMGRYAPHCTEVFPVACVADLARATRAMVRR